MNNLDTERIAAQLQHFTHEETIALVCDFLAELDQEQQARFLGMVKQGPRPLAAEAMGLGNPKDLLEDIRQLHDAIAHDHYVEYGAGYDPDYGDYRGFGNDSWIDEMDDLFEAATRFFRAGQWKAAIKAYLALFDIFELNQDGYHFTRPNPATALHTDLDEMKRNLFVAIGRGYPDPASKAIETSDKVRRYGSDRYALLDAWQGRAELTTALESALIALARRAINQSLEDFLPHASELLREYYRRYRALPDYESLCRKVGRRQGWPYRDLVKRYGEQQDWGKVLIWADDGLTKLPAKSCYRPMLREARGQALLRLNRLKEAFEELHSLFQDQMTLSVYLLLREAAQAIGQWEKLYPQLVLDMHEHVGMVDWEAEYSDEDVKVAELIGFAHLLEGDWRTAVEWALGAGVPTGWHDGDLLTTVATGLLRMGLARSKRRIGKQMDEALTQALSNAPEIIQKHGDLLESAAHGLSARSLLDSAVKLYECMIEQAIGGKDRAHYAQAGVHCRMIRAIRHWQGREADFDRYYRDLLATHSRRPALKDELRQAIERGR